ncbi:hypothetical protein [Halosegnis rubeus]|uniref:hypothetical protein n=1 Tax=Halosegnis rubeus TaxID=2212850 RepID=UPI0018D5D814|nr:hypothetical protein [Halosegnis rubeus]
MDASELESRLGVPVTTFDSTPDTSGYLRRQIPNASHGSFAVTNELTAARGCTGNAWAVPPGGVWSSTLLYPDLDPVQVGRLTVAGGVAACEMARSLGVDARRAGRTPAGRGPTPRAPAQVRRQRRDGRRVRRRARQVA